MQRRLFKSCVRKYSTATYELKSGAELKPTPYKGPSFDAVKEARKNFLNPAIFHYYKNPIMIVQGMLKSNSILFF